jgi:hypothetical protein
MIEELIDRAARLRHQLGLWGSDWHHGRIGASYLLEVVDEILDQVEALLDEAEKWTD